MNRFTLISPQRWYSSTGAVALIGPFPIVGALLVWFGPSTIEDHSADAAVGFFAFFGLVEVIWLFVIFRNHRGDRDPRRNYVELSPDGVTIAWSGAKKRLPRSQIQSFTVRARSSGFGSLLRGFQWRPAASHVELFLEKPVWFSFITLGGHWRSKSVPLEVEDLDGFCESLSSLLVPAPSL